MKKMLVLLLTLCLLAGMVPLGAGGGRRHKLRRRHSVPPCSGHRGYAL